MAFKLRSGNGALPFKQMGATPTKLTLGDVKDDLKDKDEIKSEVKLKTRDMGKYFQEGLSGKKDMTLKTDASKEIRGLEIKDKDTKKFGGKAADLGAKKLAEKIKKGEKIEGEEGKKKKGWGKKFMDWRKSEKGQAFFKGLEEAGQTISLASDEETTLATAHRKIKQQEKDNETQALYNRMNKNKLDNYKKGDDFLTVPSTDKLGGSFASETGEDGDPTASFESTIDREYRLKSDDPGYLGKEFARQDREKKQEEDESAATYRTETFNRKNRLNFGK